MDSDTTFNFKTEHRHNKLKVTMDLYVDETQAIGKMQCRKRRDKEQKKFESKPWELPSLSVTGVIMNKNGKDNFKK